MSVQNIVNFKFLYPISNSLYLMCFEIRFKNIIIYIYIYLTNLQILYYMKTKQQVNVLFRTVSQIETFFYVHHKNIWCGNEIKGYYAKRCWLLNQYSKLNLVCSIKNVLSAKYKHPCLPGYYLSLSFNVWIEARCSLGLYVKVLDVLS